MARLFAAASLQYTEIDQAAVSGCPLSAAGWIQSSTNANNQAVFWIGDASETNIYYALMLGRTGIGAPIRLERRDAGGITDTDTTTAWSTNTWHHIAMVCAANDDAAVYLDAGGKSTSAVSRTPSGWDRMAMACLADSSRDTYLTGSPAEWGLWNAALTDDEIAILALGYSPLLVRPQSLVAYWREIRDDTDIVGGYTMSPTNNPTWADHPRVRYFSLPLIGAPSGAPCVTTVTITATVTITVMA